MPKSLTLKGFPMGNGFKEIAKLHMKFLYMKIPLKFRNKYVEFCGEAKITRNAIKTIDLNKFNDSLI